MSNNYSNNYSNEYIKIIRFIHQSPPNTVSTKSPSSHEI